MPKLKVTLNHIKHNLSDTMLFIDAKIEEQYQFVQLMKMI